ncbi:hypothetical protein HUN01_28595 [Nostoc edaphicum CCNP1411]|uniref:Uncharacterized protein n=1 Tax=Nostoc edaphicum CCNP1411 TaxID=1472755 RepID=A0A7D7QN53_9NOSO|nr:hypothetical protein [Nostoc edaphicum]QMS91364.1 hypothetical protein HUN01_28595 [Nostoc edaphicum CCNP1411]
MKSATKKLETDLFIVSWTEDREITEEDLNTIVNQEAEIELDFFQRQKLGDIDRWDNKTPRLGVCDDFKFWPGELWDGPAVFFKGYIKDPDRVKAFLSKTPKLLPKRPNQK